jgi:hypothetical protein
MDKKDKTMKIPEFWQRISAQRSHEIDKLRAQNAKLLEVLKKTRRLAMQFSSSGALGIEIEAAIVKAEGRETP